MCGSMGIHLFLCMLGLSCFLSHKWEYTEGDVLGSCSQKLQGQRRGGDRTGVLNFSPRPVNITRSLATLTFLCPDSEATAHSCSSVGAPTKGSMQGATGSEVGMPPSSTS